jgi:hypothetical protein
MIVVLTAACTNQGGSGSETTTRAATESAPALVELPRVDLDLPAPGAEPMSIAIGGWDWGAPCRVPVDEQVGGAGPQFARSFTIDVADDTAAGGFLMTFVDVDEQLRGLSEQVVAAELDRYLAVLPTIRLDTAGRFVEFVDLESSLSTLAERAGVALTGDEAATLARRPDVIESVLDRTILGWFGFWSEDEFLPLNPARLSGRRVRHIGDGVAVATTEVFAGQVSENVWGPRPEGQVWLIYNERVSDISATTVDDRFVTERLDVSAIIDPENLRPSYVTITIGGVTSAALPDGGTGTGGYQHRRLVLFDWDNAEGCE